MNADDNAVRRRPVPPRTHCPPSHRGHAWQAPEAADLAKFGTAPNRFALRICKRCGKHGCVNDQGVVKEIT